MSSIHNKTKREAFTLVEIMVAVSIFSVVMMIAIGAVLAIVSANKKAQTLSSVMSNLNLAVEGMVRDIRTGYTYNCSGDKNNVNLLKCPNKPASTITITSSQYSEPVRYYVNNGKIFRDRLSASPEEITSSEVFIDNLEFYIEGNEKESNPSQQLQPIVLMIIKGHSGVASKELSTFSIQTTIVQRRLDL